MPKWTKIDAKLEQMLRRLLFEAQGLILQRLGIDFGAILPHKLSFFRQICVHVNPKGGRRDPA